MMDMEINKNEENIEVLRQENIFLKAYAKRKCGIMSKCGHGQSNQDTQEEISIYQKPCLSMEQKLDIARQFSHELTQELSSKKLNSQRSIQNLKILLDETEMRIADLQRDARDFKKEIVVEGENELTGRTMAEKVVRYMDGKLQHKEIMIEKYRLKSTILKAQKRKLEMQLKEKEKGGTLHYIDFHQLQTENKQLNAQIEEKNKELFSLKSKFTRNSKKLDDLKRQISQTDFILASDSKELEVKKSHVVKIREEIEKVKKQLEMESEIQHQLKENISENHSNKSSFPDVEGYMEQKKTMYKLRHEIKSYERKVEILEKSRNAMDIF